ncbi:hypothetical protein FZC66_14635 [Priestia megaterium]|nr:hypothetical protein FZC66_14635 [Priestia megaterium]
MVTLYELVQKVQADDQEAVKELLERLQPKINQSISFFSYGDREDIEQELKIKIIQAAKAFKLESTPSLGEFFSKSLSDFNKQQDSID